MTGDRIKISTFSIIQKIYIVKSAGSMGATSRPAEEPLHHIQQHSAVTGPHLNLLGVQTLHDITRGLVSYWKPESFFLISEL